MNNLFKKLVLALGLCAAATAPGNAEIVAQTIMQNPKTGQVVQLLHLIHAPTDDKQFAKFTGALQKVEKPTTVLVELCDFQINHDLSYLYVNEAMHISWLLEHRPQIMTNDLLFAANGGSAQMFLIKDLLRFNKQASPIHVVPIDQRDWFHIFTLATAANELDELSYLDKLRAPRDLVEIAESNVIDAKNILRHYSFYDLIKLRFNRCKKLYEAFCSEIIPQFPNEQELTFNRNVMFEYLEKNKIHEEAVPACAHMAMDQLHLKDLKELLPLLFPKTEATTISLYKQLSCQLDLPALYEILKPTAQKNIVVLAGSLHCQNLQTHLESAGYQVLLQSSNPKEVFQDIVEKTKTLRLSDWLKRQGIKIPQLTTTDFELIHPDKLAAFLANQQWQRAMEYQNNFGE